jgi:hypothetical protein
MSRYGGKGSGMPVWALASSVTAPSTTASSHEATDRLNVPKSGRVAHRNMTPVHAAAEVVDVGNAARVAAIPLVRGRDDGRKSRLVLEGTPRPSGEIDLQDQLGEEARGGCRCGFWCVLATRHLFHLLCRSALASGNANGCAGHRQ